MFFFDNTSRIYLTFKVTRVMLYLKTKTIEKTNVLLKTVSISMEPHHTHGKKKELLERFYKESVCLAPRLRFEAWFTNLLDFVPFDEVSLSM